MHARIRLPRTLLPYRPQAHLRPQLATYLHCPERTLCPLTSHPSPLISSRPASSSSSTRWKTRATSDPYNKLAKVSGLKSRAAYKLLELDSKHHLFRRGDTVVDLGYAPGSWSQVAVNRTSPGGRVVGIDVIPAQPPRGASSIQGNFLSEEVQAEVRGYVRDYGMGRVRVRGSLGARDEAEGDGEGVTREELDDMERGVVGRQEGTREQEEEGQQSGKDSGSAGRGRKSMRARIDEDEGRVVDVVLSDMMMNTSGMSFRDHAGSMDLCDAALTFCYDTLRTGGNFLCKFYQGAEDKKFEMKLKKLFDRVHREKPESSRSESKEAYFVALRRKPDVERTAIFPEDET